jgi:PAS domain S-box-containing protein
MNPGKKSKPFSFRLNLKVKLIAAMMFVALFFSSWGFISGYLEHKNFILRSEETHLRDQAAVVARTVSFQLLNLKNRLLLIGRSNEILRKAVLTANLTSPGELLGNPAALVLNDIIEMSDVPISKVYLTDRSGIVVATTSQTSHDDFSHEDWWQRAIHQEEEAGYLTGDGDVSIAVALRDDSGRVIGVLKTFLNADQFFKRIILAQIQRGDTTGIFGSGGAGIIEPAFSSFGLAALKKDIFSSIVQERQLKQKVISLDQPGILCGYHLIDGKLLGNGEQWVSACFKSMADVFAPMRKITIRLFLFWAVFLCVSAFFAAVMTKKIAKSVEILKGGLENVKKGIFNRSLYIKSNDELESLGQVFNEMLETLSKNVVSRDYFDQIIQNMSDILFVVNPYGFIEFFNKPTCDALGYGASELKGKEAIEIFAKKDRYIVNWGLKGVLDQGALKDKEIKLVSKSGNEIEVYLGARYLRDANNCLLGLICLAKDLREVNKLMKDLRNSNEEAIRHKKELEKSLAELTEGREIMLSILEDMNESHKALEQTLKKLKETQDELLQAEKMVSLGQIAAGVAHEINNPLFVISGEAEMLNMDEGVPRSAKESVLTIQEQAKRIGEIIKRLLEFSRKKESTHVPMDINAMMGRTIELLRYQTRALGYIEINQQLSDGALIVNGDQNQLQEVFFNLMINAVQAMEETGGSLTVRSFPGAISGDEVGLNSPFKEGDDCVRIEVADTGIGMNEEIQKKIFDPFFTTKKTGTGLGLSVCLGLIESHKGMITVKSEVGKGTKFTVNLPRVKNG